MLLFACTNEKPAEKKVQEAAATSPPQYEFADPKYVEIGKQAFEALSKGNVDQWLGFFADNAVYQWNNFDSLAGKAAIDEFWRKRRTEVVNNLVFSGHIFLPMKVNKPQAGEQAGNWLLTWCVVDVTYQNGNKMVQFMHIDYHFDANDKIDRVLQFLDNEPINKALAAN
jgi:hypothetical protein